jgi:hypothetical protein
MPTATTFTLALAASCCKPLHKPCAGCCRLLLIAAVPPLLSACVQAVVTYTATGPTTNGKTVLANCQVSWQSWLLVQAAHRPCQRL